MRADELQELLIRVGRVGPWQCCLAVTLGVTWDFGYISLPPRVLFHQWNYYVGLTRLSCGPTTVGTRRCKTAVGLVGQADSVGPSRPTMCKTTTGPESSDTTDASLREQFYDHIAARPAPRRRLEKRLTSIHQLTLQEASRA